MEQGIPGILELRIFSDEAATTPWSLAGWEVKASISDIAGNTLFDFVPVVDAANGIVKLFLPEATVNQLSPERSYRYDALMVAPGGAPENDAFLATGPVLVSLRSTRRTA